jgi:hypothetical protein
MGPGDPCREQGVNEMSATVLMRQPKYQAQLKLARAETAVAWAIAAIDRAIAALKIEPSVFELDQEAASKQRWFGSFY